jgi:segregation and condensation protein A
MSPSLIPQPFGSGYNVQLPSFQGPLELLLSLIEQNQLDISSISLMVVTEQYLRSVERLEVVDPGALADFLVVASRLLYIKSYSLLPKPRPPVEDEEEASGEALVRQLLEYRRFKEIAATLKEREEQGLRLFVRTAPVQDLPRRLDLTDVDVELLNLALRQALQRIPPPPLMPRIKSYTITVAEQIEIVRRALARAQGGGAGRTSLSFTELLSSASTRQEVVVTFLAVLELVKLRAIEVRQSELFGDILLEAVAADSETAATPVAGENVAPEI